MVLKKTSTPYLLIEATRGDDQYDFNFAAQAKEILDAAKAYETALNAVEETGEKVWENRIVRFSHPCTNVGSPEVCHRGWRLAENELPGTGFRRLIDNIGHNAEGQPNSYCGWLPYGCLACHPRIAND